MNYKVLILKGALFLINAHVLLAAGIPAELFLALLIFLAALHVFAEWRNLALLTATLALTVVTAEVALRMRPPGAEAYRPQDRLSMFDSEIGSRYRRNATVEMIERHGDLMAYSPIAPKSLWQPHQVTFATDSLGFRNTGDYRGQPYIFIGDSFVAGLGNTQEDLLSEQIRRDHGVEAYNLAHPGEPEYYAKLIAAAEDWFTNQPKLILFLYEGNDFPDPAEADKEVDMTLGAYVRWYYAKYRQIVAWPARGTKVQQTWQSLYLRARVLAEEYLSGEPNAIIYRIGPQDMAFSRAYATDTLRANYDGYPGFDQDLKPVLSSVSLLVFIPSKYRVYREFMPPEAGDAALPDAQWSYVLRLSRDFGIPALNLTEALQAESRRLLSQGEYTYWRDDSHWNANGIRVAAAALAKALAALPKP